MKKEQPGTTLLDLASWPRRTHFEAYSTTAACASHVTSRLDITALRDFCRKNAYKFYPAMIVLVSEAVNRIPEFRMTLTAERLPAIWNHVSPSYTIFHNDDRTFSTLNTRFTTSRSTLYCRLIADTERHRDDRGIAVGEQLPNVFHISCLPWLDFTAFAMQLHSKLYLAPIITWGKYQESDGKVMLPVAVSIHHAAADGYHIAEFFRLLQELCRSPAPW